MGTENLWKEYALVLEELDVLNDVLFLSKKGPFPPEMYKRYKDLTTKAFILSEKMFKLGMHDPDHFSKYDWSKYLIQEND